MTAPAPATVGRIVIVRTAAGWTVEGNGTPLAYLAEPFFTAQFVGGLARHYERKGYTVTLRDERGRGEG